MFLLNVAPHENVFSNLHSLNAKETLSILVLLKIISEPISQSFKTNFSHLISLLMRSHQFDNC